MAGQHVLRRRTGHGRQGTSAAAGHGDHPPAACRAAPAALPPGTRRRDVGGWQGTGGASEKAPHAARSPQRAVNPSIHPPHGLVRFMCRARAPCHCQPGPRPRALPRPPCRTTQRRPVGACVAVERFALPASKALRAAVAPEAGRTCTGCY